MSFTCYTNPVKFGPGLWFCIHTLALNATTPELQGAYCVYVRLLAENLRCNSCRGHFLEYIRDHPPDVHIGGPLDKNGYCPALFRWSWKLHEAVNIRIGKESVSLDEAYDFFAHTKLACVGERCKEKRPIIRHRGLRLTARVKN